MAGDIRGSAMVSREVAYHVTESVKVGPDFGLDTTDPAVAKRHVTVRPSDDLRTRLKI